MLKGRGISLLFLPLLVPPSHHSCFLTLSAVRCGTVSPFFSHCGTPYKLCQIISCNWSDGAAGYCVFFRQHDMRCQECDGVCDLYKTLPPCSCQPTHLCACKQAWWCLGALWTVSTGLNWEVWKSNLRLLNRSSRPSELHRDAPHGHLLLTTSSEQTWPICDHSAHFNHRMNLLGLDIFSHCGEHGHGR